MAAQGLKDYLQRYVDKPSGEGDGGTAKLKKKKRNGKNKSSGGGNAIGKGVIILDDDVVWYREQDDEDEPEEDGDRPMVIEDVEVKQMLRMDALKTYRPYLSMADDGSGWVTLMDDDCRFGGDNSAPTCSTQGKSPEFCSKRRRNDSPDLSPPRKRNDSPDQSSLRRRKDSPDLSPVKRRKGFSDFSGSSSPRRKKESSDLSPPRRKYDLPPEDKSPVVSADRKRMDSPDFSPPRRRKGRPDVPVGKGVSSHDLDPPRRSKFSSSGGPDQKAQDFLPPRRRKDPLDLSSPRRRHDSTPQRGDSGDVSTKRKGFDSPDLSPLRRKKGSGDLSPLRRSKISSSGDSRMSKEAQEVLPPRKRRDSPESSLPRTSRIYPDLLPPRRRRDSPHPELAFNDSRPPRKPQSLLAAANQYRHEEDLSPPCKKGAARMSDGTFAGLEKRPDREVISDAERKRAAEAKKNSELDPSLSGRGAETVFRDKRGRRLEGLEEMLRQQRGEKVKPVEQPLEWGKGLAQKKVSDQNLAELEAEKSKPFARYRDDVELDKSLRERWRWGDPMGHLVKPTTAEPVLEDLGAREEMKASGFIVPQDIPKHSWLKRGIAPPPNRYDIRPGRHWDGVDRSAGFEQGLFKRKNEKKARELEAYLWSVSDM